MLNSSELITGEMSVTGLMDRTMKLFRKHFYAYTILSFLTYGLPSLVMYTLLSLDYITLDWLNDVDGFDTMEFRVTMLLLLVYYVPMLFSDLALHEYTRGLAYQHPISIWQAIRRTFGIRILNYAFVWLFGAFLISIFTFLIAFFMFVPFVGFFLYIYAVLGVVTAVLGLAPAIIIEEKRWFFGTIRRNINLVMSNLLPTTSASAGGFISVMALVYSALLLLFLLVSVLSALLAGSQFGDQLAENNTDELMMNFMFMIVPVLLSMTYTALRSLSLSVIYYSLRCRKEALHLELFLDRQADGQGVESE